MSVSRYDRLRAAVVEVIDPELGSDADGMRLMLLDALVTPDIPGKESEQTTLGERSALVVEDAGTSGGSE